MSYLNYLRVIPGLSQKTVERFLGGPGDELERDEVTQVVDWSQPVGSPNRLKTVIDGDRFFRWPAGADMIGTTYVIVSFRNGVVYDKHHWSPSW
jgi:hypothetical protein